MAAQITSVPAFGGLPARAGNRLRACLSAAGLFFTQLIGGGGPLRRFASALARDREASCRLTEKIEDRFLKTAARLEQMTALGDKLLKDTEQAFEAAVGNTNSENLKSPGHNLIRWLNCLDENQEALRPLLRRITSHQRRIDHILNQEKRLRQTVSTLQILPSLFKIEAARLPPENRPLFLALVRDIQRVHLNVAESLSGSFGAVESLGRRLAEGRSRFDCFIETKCRAIGERKTELEASLVENNRQLEAIHRTSSDLLANTRETHQHIGRVVIALQFQDITRQKLQHIDKMRGELEHVIANHSPARKTLQFCSEAATLCQAHCESTGQALRRACDDINEGVGQLRDGLDRLDETSRRLREFIDSAVSAEGFIQRMLDASDELEFLTRDLVEGIREMHTFLDPLKGALTGLSMTMGQVSAEIRLVALNAQVQAIQNGLGTGLEILSARTCDVADEMYAIGEQMTQALQELNSVLQADLERFSEIHKESEQVMSALANDWADEADRLHAYRDRALSMYMAISAGSSEIAACAEEVSAGLDFEQLAGPTLTGMERTLRELREASDHALQPGRLPFARGQSVEHFRNYYSVADEIETHNRLFGPGPGAPQATPAPTRAPSVATGSFQPLPSLAPDTKEDSSGIELFEEFPEPSSPSPEAAPAEKQTGKEPAVSAAGLGDNIELF